jgi:chromate reductase, NAD(P)H dehydrogenase (quinone)
MTPKILAFAGSARRGSWNKMLVRIAAGGARAEGIEVTLIELEDYALPLFNQDEEVEHGLPPNGRALKDLFISHQGFLISSPEYNSSISAILKNTIDWVSRPAAGEAALAGFADKTAVVMSASPGALGGLRGLVHLRSILGNIGTLVLPATFSVSKAHETFAEDGTLKDARQQATVEKLGADLARYLMKMHR